LARRRLAVRVEGRVQGVFFRESARQTAQGLGLSGWVRNLPDGAVAAEAEGDEVPLQAFVRWCHKRPPAARVTAVQTSEVPVRVDDSGFTVERSP
jgi:acylphosphatase